MSMIRKIVAVAALFLLGLTALGCGGAAEKTETTPKKSTLPEDPFGGDVDLRGDSESSSEVKVDLDDLKVPGEQWGLKEPEKSACPRGRKGAKCREMTAPPPYSDGIYDVMVDLPWGLTKRSVMGIIENRIRASFEDDLKNVSGAIEEDKLRSKMLREITEIRKSYIEFKGQRTGFEQNFVADEFTHKNSEAMLVYDAGKYVEHLFFIDGRFWKRVWAFRKDKLNDLPFDDYYGSLINRFGEGKEIYKEGDLVKVKWMNDDTYLSSIDKSGFYGVYLLVFSARVTEDNLSSLRTNKKKGEDDGVSSMVEAVTSGGLTDHNTSVIDSYTGEQTGDVNDTSVDASHSVMAGKSNRDGKKEEEKKEEDDDDDDASLDDLF
jgi:hypothetical protein